MIDLAAKLNEMRSRRDAAIERGVLAVLDIGSSKISCALLKFDQWLLQGEDTETTDVQNRLQILGAATVESKGVRCGEVFDRRYVQESIMRVLTMAQRQAGIRVDHALVCTSGGTIDCSRPVGTIFMNGNRISSDDLARVVTNTRLPMLAEGRSYICVKPATFAIDHRSEIADPRDMNGNTLSVELLAASASTESVNAIINAVEKCNLDLCGVVPSAHASAMSALVEDEQRRGSACVDIGAGVISIAVYYKMNAIYSKTVKLGGRFVTTDICSALSTSEETAEVMKTVHGGLYFEPKDDEKRVGYWSLDGQKRSVSRSQLTFFIKPRIEEILEAISATLAESDFGDLPRQSIVLTGGCSQMQDFDVLSREILGPKVRFGMPVRLRGLPQSLSGPQHSAVVGSCLHAMLPQAEQSDFQATARDASPRQSLGRTLQWMVSNW